MDGFSLLADFTISPHWIVGFVGAAGLVIMSKLQRRAALKRMQEYDKKNQTAAPAAAASSALPSAADTKRAAWEVPMHELTRDLSAQLDSKIVAVQQLLREVDARCDRLQGLLDSVDSGFLPEFPSTKNTTAAVAAPPEPVRAARSETPATKRPVDEIYSFSDYGLTPFEISQRVGAPLGEVELILNLRDRG